ncbi:MAG TPA: hypothetical protein VIH10_09555, partial [Kribbella sp.]
MTPEKAPGKATKPSEQFAGFGPNEWLVYEMYQQYLKDPDSVDKAWWDFFADYQPADTQAQAPAATNGSGNQTATTERQAAAEKAAPVSQPTEPTP